MDSPRDAEALLSALDVQDRNIAALNAFLSPEAEAERQRRFAANMAGMTAAREELARLLSPTLTGEE